MDVDSQAAFEAYIARFDGQFGDKDPGTFVKFGKHMVQKLNDAEFPERLDYYLRMHRTAKEMLSAGSTINDAVVLEFDEAAAWIAITAPNMLKMFSGEMGDPDVARGLKK
ncbi:MAG: hypothetical protein DRJ42_13055 [Deltaproteobacteria bacterium]|nr:MAG: hypothetical protein DRJ42_13055 [Deltaproteobacteria bacterium]